MYDFREEWTTLEQTAKGGSRALIQLAQGGQVSSFLPLLSGICACASWTINNLDFHPSSQAKSRHSYFILGAVGKY